MTAQKKHTVYVRDVTKAVKNSLKRQAKAKNQSLNGYFLSLFNALTEKEISEFESKKEAK